MVATPGATEYVFAYDDQGGCASLAGGNADATRIQTVLLGGPRAGDAEFGLAVMGYIWECGDPYQASQIANLGRQLVGKYCPGVQVADFEVQLIGSDTNQSQGGGTNQLVIGVSIGVGGNTFPFAILVTAGTRDTIVSQLVF